jgi:hypothetical protein
MCCVGRLEIMAWWKNVSKNKCDVELMKEEAGIFGVHVIKY